MSFLPVKEDCSYGIAIYNFNADIEYKLELVVGDTLHLLEEDDNWYYGYNVTKRQQKGVFPKSYVFIKPCTVDSSGPVTNFVFKEPPVVQEITSVLREWGLHWKNLYVTHNKDFEVIKTQMYDLISHRSKIISGTLPVDELKRVTKQASKEIDIGNKVLGLDLVVRDQNGNLINPDETSTIRLFYQHKYATERMNLHSKVKSDSKLVQPKTAIQQYSNIFIVSVKNFTCKMSEDAELLMTLYDGKEYKALTENYVVRWSRDGLMSDLDQMYNLRVMFTDLGKKDLEREKTYFVCYVVRVGSVNVKDQDHRRSSVSIMNKPKLTLDGIRRPFGVAAMEITNFLNGSCDSDLQQEYTVPFVCCEKDNLEQTLKKIISKDFSKIENKNQALFISMKLLRGDLKQVREENPHLVLGNVSIARKMGFPEVILPGDVRNDLYLTLIGGEFNKGSKTSDKNVEVTVKVCNEQGVPIPGVIGLGGGVPPLNEYHSVIYYHEDKPQWHETFKVAIPIEEFKTSHLKFIFKHRSSNEAKDKNEKPFGMSYVRLMETNGTTLQDLKHSLIVYKIDYKKFNEKSMDYFNLPSKINDIIKDNNGKPQCSGLSVSSKDSFAISSNICSTKLTQNVDLLGLLNWSSNRSTIKESLQALIKVDGEEVVKFLQDILDALFNILMHDQDSDVFDKLVFECLLHIIGLVSNNWKFQHFEPVLDLYIRESFSATLAYRKIIKVLKTIITKSITEGVNDELLFKTMKSLQYVIKFISKSRLLHLRLYMNSEDTALEMRNDFEHELQKLLDSISHMMSLKSDQLLREQGACLKYFPSTIPDILIVFDPIKLSLLLCDLINNMETGRLTKQKMMTINEIVHSQLFLYSECRNILVPVFSKVVKLLLESSEEGVFRHDGRRQNRSVAKVAQLLGTTQHYLNQHRGYSEEVELCIKVLSDMLELLFRKDIGNTMNDVNEIIVCNLRTVIQTHINMQRDNPHSGNLVAVMIDIFRQMTEDQYNNYIKRFKTPSDILDFLMEILLVFKALANSETSIFPCDWNEMIMLQNHIILKSIRYFSHTIRDSFFKKFESQAWSNFFHCAIAFMTQPALQLENFSHNKRIRIVKRYKDMRRETGFEIRSMWFNLGTYKKQFVPSLVGSILEMTLIPEIELRKATIPIFFDMMQCEFYSSKYEEESYGDTKWDPTHIKANFTCFENEMIAKLDTLVEGGRGDEDYKNLFNSIMVDLCSQHTTMREDGVKFVKIVTRLMERLLEYRCIIKDENKENRMTCTVNLLDFYSEINRKEMYIRYLNKLCDLHLEYDNYTEAAFTLELHAKLLKWSDEILPPILKTTRCTDSHTTHRQLKQALYYSIIEYYSQGKMWECAIEKCQELAKQCEEETFDYDQLSTLHTRMAQYYDDIMKKVRAEPEYFRVGYYGKGFPLFLQNKVFIYRGKEYERLSDFNHRIMNEFPKAILLNKLTPPEESVTKSDKQYIQINKVDPVMDEKKLRFSGKPVSEQIIKYYRVNAIRKFTYSRPFTKKDGKLINNNEFGNLWIERTELETTYPLPGILRWFPVKHCTNQEISPLRNAIETIEKTNKKLKNFVVVYNKDKNIQINPLSLLLNGILDAAVMGGIKNYEEAFFTEDYMEHHSDDDVLLQRLKDLIADQVPLLEMCLQIHKDKCPPNLNPLQQRMEECFEKLQENVTEKYGKKQCDIRLEKENQVIMRRHFSINTTTSYFSDAISITSDKLEQNFTKSLLSPVKNPTTPTSINQKKLTKNTKEKRRSSSKVESLNTQNSLNNSSTQWYMADSELFGTATPLTSPNGTPIVELTQELTPKRPLRSEVEKERRSRPPSLQISRPNSISLTTGLINSNNTNRDSINSGNTDSSISEELPTPPPIPVKSREMDYCNLPADSTTTFLYSQRNYVQSVQTGKTPPAEPDFCYDDEDDDDVPPTPPPKPPKHK